MIRFENIHKRFGKLQVLKGIDVTLPKNEVVAIIGPNGSGKTTMLKCLLGLVKPDSGTLYVNEKPINQGWNYREKIGYMSQISRFPENVKIRELFAMMRDLRTDVMEYDEDLLKTFKLDEIYEKKLGTLSGGTKQKVSSTLAFLFKPEVLILDEPTAGLDPVATEQIKEKIAREKANGKLVIITSHIMADIEELCDSIVYILDGKIRFHSSINEVKTRTGETIFSKAMAKITQEYAQQ